MLILIVIVGAVIGILFSRLFLLNLELKNIAAQLREIEERDTNRLVTGKTGMAKELINEINRLLTKVRENRLLYRRKKHDIDRMMVNISHDLRTPLTSAMGYLNLIESGKLPKEEQNRELQIIGKRLSRMEELMDAFFEFSEIIGSGKPEREKLNLIGVLEESIAHRYDDFSGQGREILFECAAQKIVMSSNKNMLMRIFDNLIGNAYQHAKSNLWIRVLKGDDIRITFRNEMTGLKPNLSHIFDEFYTTDISRTKGNTGLGLTIANRFTQMLGGTISVRVEGGDILFTIIFS